MVVAGEDVQLVVDDYFACYRLVVGSRGVETGRIVSPFVGEVDAKDIDTAVCTSDIDSGGGTGVLIYYTIDFGAGYVSLFQRVIQ